MNRPVVLAALLVIAVTPAAAHVNHVSADPQVSPDGTVVVEAIFPAADGWLVVHRDDGGAAGEPIGAAPIEGGSFVTDFPVKIDRAVWRTWTGSQRLHVVLHGSDGDGRFEPGVDEPRRTFDRLVADDLTLAAGQPARVGVEGFSPQTVTEPAVTIRSVTMPTAGTLVIRTGTQTGSVVGRTRLPAGTHGPVTVAIDSEALPRAGETATLYAGIQSGPDQPLSVGDSRVGSTVGIRVPENATITEREPAARAGAGHAHTHDTAPRGTSGARGPGLGLLVGVSGLAIGWLLHRRR